MSSSLADNEHDVPSRGNPQCLSFAMRIVDSPSQDERELHQNPLALQSYRMTNRRSDSERITTTTYTQYLTR